MPSAKNILMGAAFALVSSVNAHMIMLTPIPFGNSTLSRSPLDASGSDYPCKQRPGVYDVEVAINSPMVIGAPQTLSFIGGATHGGGSCQISITTDKNPTKDTKWQVIRSILGDCPSNFDGNLSENPYDTGSTKFQFSIPEGIEPGDYVLAWTWFNRMGNREMYMNCAPITVIAGSKKRSTNAGISNRADAFPDIFKANIDNGCATAYGGNVIFPDPGPSVEKHPTFPSIAPVGSCGTKASASISGNTNSTGSTGSSNPGAAPAAAPAPVAPLAPAPEGPAAPVAPSAPAAASPALVGTAAPAAPVIPNAPPPAGANASSGSCPTPGLSVCSPDGKQIGTCDGTNHVTFYPVAQGTICQGGYMVMAESNGPALKRSAKSRGGHTCRHNRHRNC